jgi:hypothetical protein
MEQKYSLNSSQEPANGVSSEPEENIHTFAFGFLGIQYCPHNNIAYSTRYHWN